MVHISSFIRPVTDTVATYLGTAVIMSPKQENFYTLMPLSKPILDAALAGISSVTVSMAGETITNIAGVLPKGERDVSQTIDTVQLGIQPLAIGIVNTGLHVLNDYSNTKQWGIIEPLKCGVMVSVADVVSTFTLEQFKFVIPGI